MNRKKAWRLLACILSLSIAFGSLMPLRPEAKTTTEFTLREKAVSLAGILNTSGDRSRKVTRAQFARMLVLGSAYRSVLTKASNVSVFNDVAQGDEYASAIRLAAENGWMTGYLGGNFHPDQYVTLNEAAKGLLYLLGYSSSDFTGDEYNKRMAKYAYLGLNENVNYSDPATTISYDDCINLFYNLMKCDKKDTSTAYVTVFDGTLSSDGEVDVMDLIDNSLKGPKAVKSRTELKTMLPFDLEDASLFLDGKEVTQSTLEAACSGYLVVYYSTSSKSVWAYDTDSTGDKRIHSGTISEIDYSSTSSMTPTKVIMDDGSTFTITSSDMQYAFSIYGDLHVGDYMTAIYQLTSTSSSSSSDDSDSEDEDSSVTGVLIDYVED